MCIASFRFNLNGVETESIILKQFSVLRALQVYKEMRIMHGNQEKEK